MKTKVYTKQCKSCTKGIKNSENKDQKFCVWGKSKKLLVEPKGKKELDCKLIGR